MPLHDWSNLSGWEGVHLLWIAELLRHIKSELPTGFRAFLGSGPALAVGAPSVRPDIAVRAHENTEPLATSGQSHTTEPDIEVAVAELEPAPALFVEHDNRLVAAVELVSPRNKDRPFARATYLNRYVSYLMEGIHLMLIDVHRRPAGFSFADEIAKALHFADSALPAPMCVSYRVGEPAATGGRLLAIWRRPLSSGAPLPKVPLPLDIDLEVEVDLEATYHRAAADAYLT